MRFVAFVVATLAFLRVSQNVLGHFSDSHQMSQLRVIVGDCSLVRRFCSPKVRESEIKDSSFRRFCSPKVRKSDNDFYSFLL